MFFSFMQESPLQLSNDIHKVKKHWESMIILKKLIKSSAKHCNSEKFLYNMKCFVKY